MSRDYILEGDAKTTVDRHNNRHKKAPSGGEEGQAVDVWHLPHQHAADSKTHVSSPRYRRFFRSLVGWFSSRRRELREFATETATTSVRRSQAETVARIALVASLFVLFNALLGFAWLLLLSKAAAR